MGRRVVVANKKGDTREARNRGQATTGKQNDYEAMARFFAEFTLSEAKGQNDSN
jgi:hypothetical protein